MKPNCLSPIKVYSQKEPITVIRMTNCNDDESDDNGDDDNGQNLFDMASTLRTSRKSPWL